MSVSHRDIRPERGLGHDKERQVNEAGEGPEYATQLDEADVVVGRWSRVNPRQRNVPRMNLMARQFPQHHITEVQGSEPECTPRQWRYERRGAHASCNFVRRPVLLRTDREFATTLRQW